MNDKQQFSMVNSIFFFQIWLIEINVNPCLATNCEALKEVVPGVVRETLGNYLLIRGFRYQHKSGISDIQVQN